MFIYVTGWSPKLKSHGLQNSETILINIDNMVNSINLHKIEFIVIYKGYEKNQLKNLFQNFTHELWITSLYLKKTLKTNFTHFTGLQTPTWINNPICIHYI